MGNFQTSSKNVTNATNFEPQPETNDLQIDYNENFTENVSSLEYLTTDKDVLWKITNKYSNNVKSFELPSETYVLSSFEITEGVYFYEIEILENLFNKNIVTGWVTKFVDFFSYFNSSFTHDAEFFIYEKNILLPGDTIGYLVNVEQKKINVYFNEQLVSVNINENIFKNLPIFAFTAIKARQKIKISLRNITFKYPLIFNKHYKTFHSIKKSPSFQIKIKNNNEWFCEIDIPACSQYYLNFYLLYSKTISVFDNDEKNLKYQRRFSDFYQKQLDEKIIDIEKMINNGNHYYEILNFVYNFIKKSNNANFFQNDRILQSIVETIGHQIQTNKLIMLDQCIFIILNHFCDYKKSLCFYHSFFKTYILNFFETNDFKNNNFKNQTKIHNICLILYFFIDKVHCCQYLINKCIQFLYNVLQHSTDPWCQLYSLMGLLETSKTNQQFLLNQIFKKEKAPFLIWKKSLNRENALKNTRVKENSAQLQLYQYLHYYLSETSQTENVNASIKIFFFEIFCSEYFIFSFSNLMVRNNSFKNDKTIRYKFSINPPTFYFEVTIITVGSMKIGLAAKQMDIKDVVGQNAFSIGIDGYHRCVWMHKKEYKFKAARPEWNAGDVIGIYVDFINRSVIFGINNKIIEIDGDPFKEEFIFSILPCHVAASFDKNQQCFFNFDFKVAPNVFLNKLESTKQKVFKYRNAFVVKNGTAKMGNVTIKNSKQIMERKKTKTKLNPFFWKTVNSERGFKYMRILGEIYQKFKSDAQKHNPTLSFLRQPLMLMPAPIQLEQNNFALWLNSLKMVLCVACAVQAVESALPEENPLNLIARGLILQTVPTELQKPIKKMKVAFEMLQTLRAKYEKKEPTE